jgi:hypothetical protein
MGALFKLIMGNPYTMIAAGVGALMALSAAFGGGYYLAVNQAEKNASAAPIIAAKAQEQHDIAQHQDAVKETIRVVERKVKGDTITQTIIERVPEIQYVDKECNITPEMIHLMNEAGHQ